MANDKIFNNSFDTPEFELGNISFGLDLLYIHLKVNYKISLV